VSSNSCVGLAFWISPRWRNKQFPKHLLPLMQRFLLLYWQLTAVMPKLMFETAIPVQK
jgi:hypothetical protein